MIRIISWNVNGIRATIKKGFWEVVSSLNPDIIGIQETKSDEQIMTSGVVDNTEFNLDFHSCSMKKGYSGVATFTKHEDTTSSEDNPKNTNSRLHKIDSQKGLGIEEFDIEGRTIITKYDIENPKTSINSITIINCYYPQGGREGRVDYKIKFYLAVFEEAKKRKQNGENVILIGDFNTTVADIDLARPNENRKTTGCLPEEREAMKWFTEYGFVDSFRHIYPNKPDMYSYWDQITRARERNVGWRIDFALIDEKLLPYLKQAYIWSEILGSDHCPVGIDLDV